MVAFSSNACANQEADFYGNYRLIEIERYSGGIYGDEWASSYLGTNATINKEEIRVLNKIIVNPQFTSKQIQMIKLLEIPTIQLEQRIKKELEENPTLAEGADNTDDYEDYDADSDEGETAKEQDEF